MITAKSDAVFGGVYKIVAMEKNGQLIPKIKISENVEKITNPSFKKVYRFYSKTTNHALADVIALADEVIDEEEYEIFDPQSPWKKKVLRNYYVKPLAERIYDNGKLVYTSPKVVDIAEYKKEQVDTMWEEIKRLDNPQKYYIDLSKKLWDLKNDMLNKN